MKVQGSYLVSIGNRMVSTLSGGPLVTSVGSKACADETNDEKHARAP